MPDAVSGCSFCSPCRVRLAVSTGAAGGVGGEGYESAAVPESSQEQASSRGPDSDAARGALQEGDNGAFRIVGVKRFVRWPWRSCKGFFSCLALMVRREEGDWSLSFWRRVDFGRRGRYTWVIVFVVVSFVGHVALVVVE